MIDADHPVESLTEYLVTSPNIAFIVYHEYECSRPLDAAHEPQSSEHTWPEKSGTRYLQPNIIFIEVISKDLRSALLAVGVGSSFDAFSDGEMRSPFVFIYQNRAKLRKLAENGEGEVSSLLSYIENKFQDEYQDADEKFAKGVVTQEHLTKLWLPEELLVTHVKSQSVGHVLQDQPDFRRPESRRRHGRDPPVNENQKILIVHSWSWTYDGRGLIQEHHSKSITLATHEEIAINQLPIYPLRFAPVGLEDTLKSRGNKVWNLRRQHLVAYTGRDFANEKTYVNSHLIFP